MISRSALYQRLRRRVHLVRDTDTRSWLIIDPLDSGEIEREIDDDDLEEYARECGVLRDYEEVAP